MYSPMSRDEFIYRFKNIDEALYNDLSKRGYYFYGSSYTRFADGLCQKHIKDSSGNVIFTIDCWCYIYDDRYPAPKDIKMDFEARFYINKEDDKLCIMNLNTKDIDWAEDFLKNFYYAQNCN